MSDMTTHEKAVLIINSVKGELAYGTKHYNKAGKLLTTPLEIIETMLYEGRVTLEPVSGRQRIFMKLSKEVN